MKELIKRIIKRTPLYRPIYWFRYTRVQERNENREISERTRDRLAKYRAKPTGSTPGNLHLGCGDIHISGYCNIDIDFLPTVDIVDDIISLPKFESNFADQIYACHVLEHLGHDEVPRALARWLEVLRPGGELRISVPDIDRIVKIYSNNWQHFRTRGHSPWIGLLYGGQLDPYDYHKTGFNFYWLSYLLEAAGFIEISEYPHDPHFIPGVVDASLANQPFGEFISLNVMARKPAERKLSDVSNTRSLETRRSLNGS